jgi:hypothetical protein
MSFRKGDVAALLRTLDLGSSIAELDDLLESARVETSVFGDLLGDRVDLVPGTKGSGKSALYRIFVDFLPNALLAQRKVVVAHGVQSHGDNVFHVYNDRFSELSEDEFVDFWCIYLVSLAHEQFVKSPTYESYLVNCTDQINRFRDACATARIPEIPARKSLKDVIDWALNALGHLKPKGSVTSPEGFRYEIGIFGDAVPAQDQTGEAQPLPRYIGDVKLTLERLLECAGLSLWLMVDRLDEIFPRRSELETKALRGLLRTLRIFESPSIRVKVFLRDDILEQITTGGRGFAALTHVTARKADRLDWSEDSILLLIVNRLFTSAPLQEALGVERDRLASRRYREEAFYKVFPEFVYSPPNQSPTLRWIYSHTADGRGVVAPRDVIDLLTRAKQFQQDEFQADPDGQTDWIIGSAAIRYGLVEMSKHKRDTVLRAEYEHLWPHVEKLVGGKTSFTERALRQTFGRDAAGVIADLVGIGLLTRGTHSGERVYTVPFLYRYGLELSQGTQD